MTARAKTIKMLLYDGSLEGVTLITDSAWDSGKMLSAPRESIESLIKYADCKRYGVYLLLSEQQVYIGQASDLERRTKQHLKDKDWWTQVILMTTKDDSYNASDIDYLESRLIEHAIDAGTLDSDNKKQGNRQKVDEFRQAELEQYLDEALFLLELIGVHVFKRIKKLTPERVKKSNTTTKKLKSKNNYHVPALPDRSLGPCKFVKEAFTNLIDSDYTFTDDQMKIFGTIEGTKQYTKRNLPLFYYLKEGESRATCEKSIRERYWKEEFIIGKYRFLLFSQWYDNPQKGATREDFVQWYNSL